MRQRLLHAGAALGPGAWAAVFALVTAVLLTWPLVAYPTSEIFGQGGDTWADIAAMRELTQQHKIPFLPGRITDVAAPEGWEWNHAIYIATWVSTSIKYLLVLVFGATLGWNIWVLGGYVATAVTVCLLARRFGASPAAAVLGGWIVAFSPFAVANGQAHIEFSQAWPLALQLWAMLDLFERPSRRNGLKAGAATVVALSFNPYFILFALVLWGVLAFAVLVRAARRRDRGALVATTLSGLPILVTGAAFGLASRSASGTSFADRDQSELVVYSLRPLQFLVPTPQSPLFGDVTSAWWTGAVANGSNLAEESAYLGWTCLLLAGIAVIAAALGAEAARPYRGRVAVLVAVAIAAASFTAPPLFQPGDLTIRMPSWFVYEVTSTWRVFARFQIVLVLAVGLLAALGLTLVLRALSRRAAVAVVAIAATAVVVDLWSKPADTTAPLPTVRVLADGVPRGLVAEYPLFDNAVPEYSPVARQDQHGRPLLNGYSSGTVQEARARWLFDLADPRTAGRLALLGVTSVVYNPAPPPAGAPAGGKPGRGFTLVREADGLALLRVAARPADSFSWPHEGFSTIEGTPGTRYSWLTSDEGTIEVMHRRQDAVAGTMQMGLGSNGKRRQVTITDERGRTLYRGTVGVRVREVRFPLTVDRRTTLTLRTEAPTMPPGDARLLSVLVQEPTFRPAGR